MVWFVIVVCAFLLDWISKWAVLRNVPFGHEIPLIDGVFAITHITNKGAAWGIFQNRRWFLLLVTLAAIAFLISLFRKSDSPRVKTAISLILGGALGNFADRLFRKDGVVDFLQVYIGSYAYPAFNVADICIVTGTLLLVLYTFLEDRIAEAGK